MKNRILLVALCAVFSATSANAACEIRANTAYSNFALGPFVSATDGVTRQTGLTIEDGDILVKQPNTTSFAEEIGFSDCTHRSNGWYTCPYDNSVFPVEGEVVIDVNITGAGPVWERCAVKAADFYDASYVDGELLLARDVGQAYKGVITTVQSQTSFDMDATIPTDDNWINHTVTVQDVNNGNETQTSWVVDVDQANDRIIIAANEINFTVEAADIVRVKDYEHPRAALTAFDAFDGVDGTNMQNSIEGDIISLARVLLRSDAATAADESSFINEVNAHGDSGIGDFDNQLHSVEAIAAQTNDLEAAIVLFSGTCDSGSTTTCVDASLTQVNDFWKGAAIRMASGETKCVYDFVDASDTLTFRPLTATAAAANYYLLYQPTCNGVIAP